MDCLVPSLNMIEDDNETSHSTLDKVRECLRTRTEPKISSLTSQCQTRIVSRLKKRYLATREQSTPQHLTTHITTPPPHHHTTTISESNIFDKSCNELHIES